MVNSKPIIKESMSTLYATQGIPFAAKLSKTLFIDPDNQPITIYAMVSPMMPLPDWLSFEPTTNILSGIPTQTDTGTLILEFYATDLFNQESDHLYVTLYIQTNNGPEIRPGQFMPNQTIKSFSDFAFEIPDTIFMDPDGESLVLNLFLGTGADVPAWIKFSPENRLVYGTQNSNDVSVNLKIVATDPKSSTVATYFTVFITKNKAPLAVNEIDKINVQLNMFFIF